MYELVYGIHTVQAVFENSPNRILSVYITRPLLMRRLKCLITQIIEYNIEVKECERSYLDNKVKGALHQGIIAKVAYARCMKEKDLSNFLVMHTSVTSLLLLVLDGITDPHNLGACLRTADAAGVHLVIVPRNKSACINSTVRKVASGSAERIPFMQVTNLARVLQLLQQNNIWVIGTVIQSKKIIFSSNLIGSVALVMGSEGYGIRNLIKKNCNELVNIPILGFAASLNVSVATGICLFEVLRQRKFQ